MRYRPVMSYCRRHSTIVMAGLAPVIHGFLSFLLSSEER
jgi:hypothetical protein